MSQDSTKESPISEDLLAILVCPRSKKKVVLSEDKTKLVCTDKCDDPKCPREYRIENGIPVMLIED
ncbi:MAG: Trm112 family protein [Chloroflexi bacterium]|uniref:Trm112 family protein n=1 Tax=Candidatus Chlorohelix allophototropha TaxID=3003348 RepID=A0A8T7M1Z1_9CHLR|nr:Trm112 family protein [Chloroflexota bacterium]WJW65567.1 hypothetical protein OZ401_001334 [Chloroflexota bacterium L227-S17]